MGNNLVTLPGYRTVEQIYAGTRTLVYRGIRESDSYPVVIKLLRSEYPNFNELVQFRNQYTIAKNLDLPGIVRPLSLETYRNGYALIMEDFGGISLKEYIALFAADGQQESRKLPITHYQLPITEFLTIAIQIVSSLDCLIRQRVIHKDIKPANILINPVTKEVKLIDFSIASLLPRETQTLTSPNFLEGTLAYLSPEQTGRMNRGIDYRSDFYSLGVSFFELLTGQLPFCSDDPMELVHCHIAKLPPALRSLNADIPPVISEIVNKLMAKNAEDRYQSALGLKHDLQNCLEQMKETGKIEGFELGKRDLCDRFLIPEKLYGRQTEVETLLTAFDRVSSGATEMMLVAGFSGIGKTAVVNEIHKPIVRQKGYFIKGKFDQFQRNIPFSAFVQAFRDLMGQLLTESSEQINQWQTKIILALGDQGQVIIEVIPELERIIGKQPPVPELAGTAAQNRFNLLFQKFIQVFTTKEHPLVIFLDDLQWADSASLKLMQLLMSETETRYLLLIGAYRDNEVQAAHPLILTLGEIQKADATINTINLAPLKQTDLNHLIADTLSCSSELALPLTELVNIKTKGNPFFATQFLKSIHEDGLINFNFESGYWQCDIAQVRALSLTDDVVEFMAIQLQKLPEPTQEVLKLAACIGNQFDLGTLSIVQEKPQTETAADLWKALKEGLIIPVSEVYKFFQDREGKVFNQLPITDYQLPSYKFLHDRVQQAAYSLIPEHHKKSTHLQIGRLLLSHIEPQEREEKIFEIVNQLNYGIELITLQKERDELAQLNVLAGRKAKAATAYEAALAYFTVGNQLLGENRWETNYDLTLSLSDSAAEVAYLNGNFEEIDRWILEVLQQAKTFLDKVKVYEVKIKSLQSENKLRESLTTGLEVLNKLGVIFPETPTQSEVQKELEQTNTLLVGREINQLIHLPKMTDVEQLAAMEICTYMMGAVYQSAPEMLPLIVLKMVNLSLKYGNTEFSADGYVLYALILCGMMGEIELGYQYGKLAMKLLEELNAQQLECRVKFTFNCCVRPWQEPLKETIYPLAKAYQIGRERGDIDYASVSSFYECLHSTWSGRELGEIERKIANYSQALRQVRQQTPLNYHAINWQFVLNLLGVTKNPCCLNGSVYQEEKMLPLHQQVNDYPALAYLHIKKLMLCYLFGEFELALEISLLAQQYSVALVGVVATPIVYFYESLAILAVYSKTIESRASETPTSQEFLNNYSSLLLQQESWLKTVNSNQEKMQKWAHYAPMNFLHKFYLVEAERYRVLGQKTEAIEMYDRAIKGARINEYTNEEALSNELAAKFYLEWGKEKIAQTYLIEAYYCYARWGAKAKVDDLEQRYPDLLAPILFRDKFNANSITTNSIASETFTSTSAGVSALLDLTTVMKAAQALSGEIVLEQLLSTLMQVLIENAGAENGCLILPKDDNLVIEAAQSSRITQAHVLQSIPIESNSLVPVTVINYVWRTQKSLVTNDATTINRFASDPYIIQRQPKSLLCSPIVNRGKLIGIVYLENNLIAGAFTSDRINILNLLTSQAAISLENARLYQNLQISEASQREKAERLAETLKILHQETRKIEFRAEIDSALTQIDSLPAILTRCTDALVNHIDAAFARIWTLNAKENILELQASSGLYTHINGSHSRIPVGKFKIGWIAQTCQPHLTNDVCNDPLISDRNWARREGMISFAGYPLTIEGQFVGVIAMFSRQPLNDSILKVLKLASYEIASGIRRKQVEEALQESEMQLRQKAQHLEQTLHQLQQAQLQMIQSEKMSALGNLVAGVAHEINNPVGFIAGNINEATAALKDLIAHLNLYQQALPHPSEQIVQDAEDIDLEYLLEDLPKMLQSMKVGCDRIRNISTSLRTFSRADSGSKVSANLHEGIDSTLMILQYRLKANETRPAIEVIKDYGEIPKVKCYFGQLNQVFMNVIANAIDALEESNYRRDFAEIKANPNQITIKTQLSADRQSVEIKIKDNGKGMPEEVKCCIFEHLFTTKGVGKGTGLGLSISRQIIEETHGGSLTCNSVLGEGTEFTILLPIDDAIRLTPH